MANLRDKAAIIGVGNSRYERHAASVSPLVPLVEAFKHALEDAGLERDDIDGLLVNIGTPFGVDYDQVAEAFGLDIHFAFWEATHRHEYRLQRCKSCGKFWAPNGPVCPHCFSTDYSWEMLSGRGRIASWVVFHKLYHPGFAKELPYNVAFVELAEGPRVIANIVGANNDDLEIGRSVEVCFEDIDDEITLPKFRLAAA